LYARLRLSALYMLAMILVVGLYSSALFFSLKSNIIEDFEDRFEQVDVRSKAVTSTIKLLEEKIILADALVLGLMGILSYILAGMTLKPIAVALEEQRKFSSDASHELRTPLTVMKTELEVALKGPELSAPAARGIFISSLEEIGRMSALIEDLLLISRGQARKVAFERVDLGALAARLAGKLSPLAAEKKVSLSFSSAGGTVAGQVSFLERMVTNIIHNAISYTPAGGSVAVAVGTEKNEVLFSVSDTGVGIATERLAHIFDRFNKDGCRGAGLGLSIVKEIVKLHEGAIRVESSPGAGTKILISIPKSGL
jgi:signal transduction histidine kinase